MIIAKPEDVHRTLTKFHYTIDCYDPRGDMWIVSLRWTEQGVPKCHQTAVFEDGLIKGPSRSEFLSRIVDWTGRIPEPKSEAEWAAFLAASPAYVHRTCFRYGIDEAWFDGVGLRSPRKRWGDAVSSAPTSPESRPALASCRRCSIMASTATRRDARPL